MPQGYLALVLHTHLPYVRHPEYDEFLEEDWLFEAITETYIPLISMFEGLERDGVPFALTLSISPTLLSMLSDSLLQNRYCRFLDRCIELAGKEIERTRQQPKFANLALMYHSKLEHARDVFVGRWQKNIVNAFKKFQDSGSLEIITCAATHGFLPLMSINPQAVRAQIRTAVRTHEKFFGAKPAGIWLPECGYEPGIESHLQASEIRYFFTDTHGVLHANPRPKYGVYAPVYTPDGVAVFARDLESSRQVWSANEGYPGDYDYRDFYRDIGFDLEYEYIRPYIASCGERKMTGFKYYRITGKDDQKEPYSPEKARKKADKHAGNFMFNRGKQIEHLRDAIGKEPLVVAPYDTELFGHWWYEGPEWLDFFIRKTAYEQDTFELTTPSRFLQKYPIHQTATPSASSWGHKGHSEYWLCEANDWIYPHLHAAADRMVDLARKHRDARGILKRALNQAARELLLAQSSDWAFIMTTGTMVEYAVKRTKIHLLRFNRLYDDILSQTIDPEWLREIENQDNLFPDIDFKDYC